MEYISTMKELYCENDHLESLQDFCKGLVEIRLALLELSDIHLKNMIALEVAAGAIWIDFDRAQTSIDSLVKTTRAR